MPTPKPCAVLFVDDVPRLTRFYQELAQMSLVHRDASHAVLEVDGLELVIHALPPRPADPDHPGSQVEVREDSYLKLCFPVPSIAGARAVAATLGGAIGPPAKEWGARGFRACDGNDPEGNVLQVREATA